ncbi:hypothetical protein LOTGIDRAFT_231366 [Lottia gigantea]|uniref:DUF4097 domain-containing protein n=1 Tax=Lottia gigantea TaxID=225164 RepID=V4C940_LOTGI|nr:hypothetical protein LOTGIDRAFT_231366 [Lottia gigantea]ESO98274.1 hypothetical protein LOTGIDRAFT_231366 [Lottia gigantea]
MAGPLRFGKLVSLQLKRRTPFLTSKQTLNSLHNHCTRKTPATFVYIDNGPSFRNFPRYFSTICTPENEVETCFYEVKTFGKINIKSPFKLDVQPLKPLDYPEMNQFICEIFDHNDPPSKSASGFHKFYGMGVSINDKKDIVNVDIEVAEGIELPLTCSIKIPIKFNINIESGDEPVSVKGFEADTINITTKKGDCLLEKLRCGNVKVVSQSGDIISATLLQGNIELQTGCSGSISGDRFQGQNINCTSEHGGVKIKSLYADKTLIQAKSGTTHLVNCHGTTNIEQDSGKIKIDSASGDLHGKINQGDIAVFVADCGKINFEANQGNVDIKLIESVATYFDLEGQSVEINESIKHDRNTSTNNSESQLTLCGTINGGSDSSSLTVKTKQGQITIGQQDWFSSLNLSSR